MTPAAIRAKRWRLRRSTRYGDHAVTRGSSSGSGWSKPWCLICEIARLFRKN
jgi:hypothetical protein